MAVGCGRWGLDQPAKDAALAAAGGADHEAL